MGRLVSIVSYSCPSLMITDVKPLDRFTALVRSTYPSIAQDRPESCTTSAHFPCDKQTIGCNLQLHYDDLGWWRAAALCGRTTKTPNNSFLSSYKSFSKLSHWHKPIDHPRAAAATLTSHGRRTAPGKIKCSLQFSLTSFQEFPRLGAGVML